MPKAPLRLSVHCAVGAKFAPGVRRRLRAAYDLLGRTALRELSVALVSDAAMKRLHGRYLGKGTVTDVLSFELEHDARGRVTAGEVVVCVPQARRQAEAGSARSRRTGEEREVLLLALHGMLHLCGFDDKTSREFTAMHRAEDRLLTLLGVGPVFHRAGRSARRTSRRTASERKR